ncbi:ABC-2 transporter permease [Lysinibacillus sphaericus]|uniref:Membrane protein n=1 Tax=Lysinibacillus sphaericus OT4b.31 TaxID=1285586 RepID=R7ZH21_LYSSH|nr:ABC-2 transporter permease [Lysinibacillus sphaericus]EON73351.1 membrane protein [Lysinibacillus sphaericus OT4b.31]
MTALLVKDLMTFQRQLKSQAIFLIAILIMSVFMQQGAILFSFIVFIVTIQAITALTYDELCNWDKYANTLPISKGEIVLSKYILSIILMIIGLVIALPFVILINRYTTNISTTDFFLIFSLIVTVAFCMLATLLPIYIKFGSIKGRMVVIALCFIPGFLLGLLEGYVTNFFVILSKLKDYSYLAPFVGLFILWLSYLISTGIYKRKDF